MIFSNMRLHKRLYLTLGILIALIFLVGEWSLWQSAQINKRVNNIYTQEVVPLESMSHLKGALYRIRDRTLRLIDAKNREEIEHHKKIINEQLTRINSEIDKYDNTRLSKEEKTELQDFRINLQQYLKIIEQKVYPKLLSESETNLETTLYKNAIHEFREAREALNRLSEYQINRAKLRYEHSQNIFQTQTIIVQLIILILVVVSFYFARSLMQSIIKPIDEINSVLKKISHKDFSSNIQISSKDEFGEISQMLNKNIKLLQSTFKELAHLVNYDHLTSLPNRKMFQEEIDKCIHLCANTQDEFAVMFIDVDNFKQVNDVYGHTVGDQLLEILAKRMQVHIRKNDIIARLGGDEFAILIHNIKNQTVAGNIANKILDSLQKPIYIDGHSIFTSVSIGIYTSNSEHLSREEILSYADVAMYAAKNSGKAQYVFFNKHMHQKIEGETRLENDLRVALEHKEFELYFQPIVEPKQETIYGVETLLRWKKDGKMITPDQFIAKLESNGMILEVTYWIVEEVFKMVQRTKYKGVVSINLSILQFFDEKLLPFLREILRKYQEVAPHNIYFEITESVFAKNNDLIYSMMELIKKEGFLFSLDDFGTGYSSLSYIKDYPIHTIKIDKKFVDDLLEDSQADALFEGIIFLANKLNLTIVVEGVEDLPTLQFVTKNSNVKIQGYYFYQPMPQNEFEALLA